MGKKNNFGMKSFNVDTDLVNLPQFLVSYVMGSI